MKITLVLHVGYGGFNLDKEMVDWLVENRGWSIIDHKDTSSKNAETFNKTIINFHGGSWYSHPNQDQIEFRSNQDLIDCVRAIRKKHENDSFSEWYYSHIKQMAIVEIDIQPQIVNYSDGHERVEVHHTVTQENFRKGM